MCYDFQLIFYSIHFYFSDEDYGSIIVWDGNFSINVRQQLLEIKQRQQLVENYLTL